MARMLVVPGMGVMCTGVGDCGMHVVIVMAVVVVSVVVHDE
jgi:hypothetical protein